MKAFASMLPALVLAAILTATGTASARADSAGDLRDAAIAEVESAGGAAGLVQAFQASIPPPSPPRCMIS